MIETNTAESIISAPVQTAQELRNVIAFQPRGLAHPSNDFLPEAIRIARDLLNKTPILIEAIPLRAPRETLFAVWKDTTIAPLRVGESGDTRSYLRLNVRRPFQTLLWTWFRDIKHREPTYDGGRLSKRAFRDNPLNGPLFSEIHGKLPFLRVTYIEHIVKDDRQRLVKSLRLLLDCPDRIA